MSTSRRARVTGRPVEAFYRPELDALRFVAFALVFCNHDLPSSAGLIASGVSATIRRLVEGLAEAGGYGVDLFFLLSAYLITEILLREQSRTGTIDLRAFWARRALRIWPLYFGFLALAYWVVPLFYYQHFPPAFALSYAVFAGNFASMAPPAGVFTVAGILWSVSIEEQFYLLWPLTLRRLRPHLPLVCIGLLAVSTLGRLYAVTLGSAPLLSVWYSTLTRLDPIAVGALLAVYLNGDEPRFGASTRLLLLVGGLLAFLGCGLWLPKETPALLLAYPLATTGAAALLLATLGAPWRIPRALVYLGRVSYGLYVFHILAIALSRAYMNHPSPAVEWPLQFVGAFAITVALASLSYYGFERPFLRMKERFSVLPASPATVSAAET